MPGSKTSCLSVSLSEKKNYMKKRNKSKWKENRRVAFQLVEINKYDKKSYWSCWSLDCKLQVYRINRLFSTKAKLKANSEMKSTKIGLKNAILLDTENRMTHTRRDVNKKKLKRACAHMNGLVPWPILWRHRHTDVIYFFSRKFNLIKKWKRQILV